MLNPRAIATHGLGFSPRLISVQGLWAQGVRRGDDGGFAYGSGAVKKLFRDLALKEFADKLEEVKEEALEAYPEAVAEAVATVSELRALDIPQDLLARLDGISANLERMRQESADRAAIATIIAAQIESAQRLAELKRQRRRREEELILSFIARLN